MSATTSLTESPRLVNLSKRIILEGSHGAPHILISNEQLLGDYRTGYANAFDRLNDLGSLFNRFDPTILITWRDRIAWLRSCYADYVMQGGEEPFEVFVQPIERDGNFDPHRYAHLAQEVFNNVRLLNVDSVNTTLAVLNMLGVQPKRGRKSRTFRRRNNSPNDFGVEVLRTLNKLGAPSRAKAITREFLVKEGQVAAAHRNDEPVSEADALAILVAATEWNSRLFKRLPFK